MIHKDEECLRIKIGTIQFVDIQMAIIFLLILVGTDTHTLALLSIIAKVWINCKKYFNKEEEIFSILSRDQPVRVGCTVHSIDDNLVLDIPTPPIFSYFFKIPTQILITLKIRKPNISFVGQRFGFKYVFISISICHMEMSLKWNTIQWLKVNCVTQIVVHCYAHEFTKPTKQRWIWMQKHQPAWLINCGCAFIFLI